MEIEELPELPPAWKWHESAGKNHIMPKWQALGPIVAGRHPLRAFGDTEDTPSAAADMAWRHWEYMSGLTKEQYFKIKEVE